MLMPLELLLPPLFYKKANFNSNRRMGILRISDWTQAKAKTLAFY